MGKICDNWSDNYPYPSLTNPNNSYCTEDRTETGDGDPIIFVTMPHFCSRDSDIHIKRNFCNNVGDTSGDYIDGTNFNDSSEWGFAWWTTDVKHNTDQLAPQSPGDSGDYPPDNANMCDYNDEEIISGTGHLGRLVTGGCCNGCGIVGSRLNCRRENYNGDPIVCCLNDYENTLNNSDCWQSPLKQRTCHPNYRNLGSKNCGDILKQYCIGTAFFPEQADWKQLWSYNSSIDINILQQSNPSVTNSDKIQMMKIKEQPCLQILARQLVGDIYSDNSDSGTVLIKDWSYLENMILTTPMLSKNGIIWAKDVVSGIILKYQEESGGFIGSLDTDSFATDSNFVSVIYKICSKFPFLCQDSLTQICKKYKLTDLTENPNIITWCGCYLNNNIYDQYALKYDMPPECTPMCNNENSIKLVNKDNYPIKCLESTCIIDDFSINLARAINPGGITFNQVCNGCGKRSVKSNIDGNPDANNPGTNSLSKLTSLSPFTYLDNTDITINNIYWQFLKLNNGLFFNYSNNLCDTENKRCSKFKPNIENPDLDYIIHTNQQNNITYLVVCCIPWNLYSGSNCDDKSATTFEPKQSECISNNEDTPNIIGSLPEKIKLDKDSNINLGNLPIGLYDPSTGEFLKDLNKNSMKLIYGELVKIIPLTKQILNSNTLILYPIFKNNYLPNISQYSIPKSLYNEFNPGDASNLSFWDLALANLDKGGGTGGASGPSGSEGYHSEDISECFCQFSGSLVVRDSFLGSANFKENCKSTKCVNDQNQEIPCGGSCTDDNGNPAPCNPFNPSDLPEIAKNLTKRKIINYGDNIAVMILLFLIILVIIVIYYYKL